MIPRKLAQKLLDEFYERLGEHVTFETGQLAAISAVADVVVEESVWVLRGAENMEQKARRYLAEGRLQVLRVEDGGLVIAECRGTGGVVYALGYDPRRKQWRCKCPKVGRRRNCAHLTALHLVIAPRP